MYNKINIKPGSFMTVQSPLVISFNSLGSSIAVSLYDKKSKIGGLANIMAPKPKRQIKNMSPRRFTDTSIDMLYESMLLLGCKKTDIKAKIIGGACLFPNLENLKILAKNNIKSTKSKLKRLKIPIIAEETGGQKGRSIEFNTTDGSIIIKQLNMPKKVL